MKGSLVVVGFFIFGIFAGLLHFLPHSMVETDYSIYALYILMFLVGISIGSDKKAWGVIAHVKYKIILVPLANMLGTLFGVATISIFVGISLQQSLAVGAGFGYYSLSSIFISKLSSEALGVVALIANISREIITLLAAPLLAKYFGKLAPIASGGATSMDTTLPIIAKTSGQEYTVISIFSGVTLTLLVPLLVTLILKL